MSIESGTPIGKYVVRRKLAEGGMAEIYLASSRGPEGFEKDVVIKRIRSFLADDPGFVQMFIAEARVASRLNHANIVQIFDFDKHEDSFYIAMEYVRGRSLWDVRKKARERMFPPPPSIVAQIGVDVARGLHHAHRLTSRGEPLHLVHRDVTPHNVLISWEGAVKLTDFGIAKAGNKLTSPGMLKGKFAYMSPEQARGEDVDARTDVFALGVVLWEMLTGARLFEADSDVAVLRAVQESVIAPPARLNPDVPPELDRIVMRALERERTARYNTAQELERALAQFLLKAAQSIDDTDIGGYLRSLYADELSDDRERTFSGIRRSELLPPQDEQRAAPVREPTAVMPGSTPSARAQTPSPPPPAFDEDAHGETFVIARRPASDAALPEDDELKLERTAVARSGTPGGARPSGAPELRHDAERAVGRDWESRPGQAGAQREASVAAAGSSPPSAIEEAAAPLGRSVAASAKGAASDHAAASGTGAASVQGASSRFEPAASGLAPGHEASSGPSGVAGAGARGREPVARAHVLDEASIHRPRSRRGPIVAVATVGALIAVAAILLLNARNPEPVASGEEEVAASSPNSAPSPAPAAEAPAPDPAEPPAPAATVGAGEPAQQGVAAASPLAGDTASTQTDPVPPAAVAGAPANAAREPSAKAEGQATPTTRRATERRAGARRKGTVELDVTPWATLFIDGSKKDDVGGQRSLSLAPGRYLLRLEHPKKTFEELITVREGRTVEITFDALK